MTNAKEIDFIYFNYQKGKIDEKKTIELLIEIIISNCMYFGLESLSKDDLIDFSTSVFLRLKKILNNYNSTKASFCTFLQTIVRMEFLSWKKNLSKTTLHSQALISYSKDHYVSEDDIYIQENPILNKSEQPVTINKIDSLDVLILSIKSVYYLSSSDIQHVMDYTKINKLVIFDYFSQANEFIQDKVRRTKILSELINIDYIRRKELLIGLSKLDENSIRYQIFSENIKKITDRLSRRKKRLEKIKISPSNRQIGLILGLSLNTVSYIINKHLRKK